MALLTGGHAYFSQDIRETLQQIARDAANTYDCLCALSGELG